MAGEIEKKMAKIIYFEKENKNKFYGWVSQYVSSKDGGEITQYRIVDLLAFLVENRVFTVKELRDELRKEKIGLDEKYFLSLQKGSCIK